MENKKDWNIPQEDTDLREDWQLAENNASKAEANDKDNTLDLRSAEASGYGTGPEDAFYAGNRDQDENEDIDETLYASDRDDDDENDDDENDDDDNNDDDDDDDNAKDDWGDIDPQHHPGPFRSSNDPSGPGSAV